MIQILSRADFSLILASSQARKRSAAIAYRMVRHDFARHMAFRRQHDEYHAQFHGAQRRHDDDAARRRHGTAVISVFAFFSFSRLSARPLPFRYRSEGLIV